MTRRLEQPYRTAPIRTINAVGGALLDAGLPLIRLEEETLFEEASRRTGLSDFGEDWFREPLRMLLASYKTEARLNFVGRIAAQQDMMQLLVNRMRLEEDRKRHPEIAGQVIQRPLFIVGLPRSGTTLLHALLAHDPGNRVPRGWEVMYPSPPPEKASYQSDRRIAEAEKKMRWLPRLAPRFEAIHRVSARLPEECIGITSHTFASPRFHTTHRVPSYQAWLLHYDLRPVYAYHRRFLQHLQCRCPAERWVLKAPAHLFALPALFETYPDAMIVQTHRDPLKVLASTASLTAVLHGAFSDRIALAEIGREVTGRWAEGLERAMAFRRAGASERFLDVHYRALAGNPIETVKRIYRHFGLLFRSDTEASMRRYLAENPKDKYGKHDYALVHFGLDPEEERRRYDAYCDYFGVEREQVDGA